MKRILTKEKNVPYRKAEENMKDQCNGCAYWGYRAAVAMYYSNYAQHRLWERTMENQQTKKLSILDKCSTELWQCVVEVSFTYDLGYIWVHLKIGGVRMETLILPVWHASSVFVCGCNKQCFVLILACQFPATLVHLSYVNNMPLQPIQAFRHSSFTPRVTTHQTKRRTLLSNSQKWRRFLLQPVSWQRVTAAFQLFKGQFLIAKLQFWRILEEFAWILSSPF